MTFRFRAQAALDLRQKQDEEAQAALAAAAAALRDAAEAVRSAVHAHDGALSQARDVEAAEPETAVLVWHRNWIIGLQRQIAARRQTAAERLAAVRTATERAMEARRRLRSLERLRDKAERAHQQAQARAEQKSLDMLGTLQHAVRRRVPEGG